MAPRSRSYALVITAAGSGIRFGKNKKKEFVPLPDGTPVLYAAVKAFLEAGVFGRTIITITPGMEETAGKLLSKLLEGLEASIIPGGKTRQDSVRAALTALKVKKVSHVLIHDGARPWVSPALIKEVLDKTLLHNACAPVLPSPDSLKEVDPSGFIVSQPDRNRILRVQTPQGFAYPEILRAHALALKDNFLCGDDTEIYSRYIGRVFTVPGERENIKITYPEDIKCSE